MALADRGNTVVLDLDRLRQPSPGAQRTVVAQKLAAAMSRLDAVIRAQRTPPSTTSPATLARQLVQRGEVVDWRGGRYMPGPGLVTMIETALADAAASTAAKR